MRPRGNPPTPKAASSEMDPVEITVTGTMASFEPRRMIDPLPNCFSIWLKVRSSARVRSLSSMCGTPGGNFWLKRNYNSLSFHSRQPIESHGGRAHALLVPPRGYNAVEVIAMLRVVALTILFAAILPAGKPKHAGPYKTSDQTVEIVATPVLDREEIKE